MNAFEKDAKKRGVCAECFGSKTGVFVEPDEEDWWPVKAGLPCVKALYKGAMSGYAGKTSEPVLVRGPQLPATLAIFYVDWQGGQSFYFHPHGNRIHGVADWRPIEKGEEGWE